ncbi:MAG TPA: hypothetical protein VK607_12615 [Kofleriaceae bacterium]|nr:hypothetical protein [Kofleriaceae bacterium]
MDDKQLEMTKELSRARGWILGVGIVMFVVDMVMIHAVYGDKLPGDYKTRITILSAAVLAFFIGMWVLARYKPVLACVLALCGFWGLQFYVASQDGASLFQGIVLKVLFTLALIRGIKSANRAEQLKKELAQVFG